MNCAEHISAAVAVLAENNQITVAECVKLIQALCAPYINGDEPKHFKKVNRQVHRLLGSPRLRNK